MGDRLYCALSWAGDRHDARSFAPEDGAVLTGGEPLPLPGFPIAPGFRLAEPIAGGWRVFLPGGRVEAFLRSHGDRERPVKPHHYEEAGGAPRVVLRPTDTLRLTHGKLSLTLSLGAPAPVVPESRVRFVVTVALLLVVLLGGIAAFVIGSQTGRGDEAKDLYRALREMKARADAGW